MAINKVVDRNGNTVIDLSTDTVNENKVLEGISFHGSDGKIHYGKLKEEDLQEKYFVFIDANDNILYKYSYEELQALTELPEPPDRTDENLAFDEWNWTLEELKSVPKDYYTYPVVCCFYSTLDGWTYIDLDKTTNSKPVVMSIYRFEREGTTNIERLPALDLEIDWGDGTEIINFSRGTQDRAVQHTYSEPGKYRIILKYPQDSRLYLSYTYYGSTNYDEILGQNDNISTSMKKVALSKNEVYMPYSCKNISINISGIPDYLIWRGFGSKVPRIPDSGLSFLYLGASNRYGNFLTKKFISLPKKIKINNQGNAGFYFGDLYTTRPPFYIDEDVEFDFKGRIAYFYLTENRPNKFKFADTEAANGAHFYLKNQEGTFEVEGGSQIMIRIQMPVNIEELGESVLILKNNKSFSQDSGNLETTFKTIKVINDKPSTVWPNNIIYYDTYLRELDLTGANYSTPPTLSRNPFDYNVATAKERGLKILVPKDMENSYRTAPYWMGYADCIEGV